jgi:hypothetical protein
MARRRAGFKARPLWVADKHAIAGTIVDRAEEHVNTQSPTQKTRARETLRLSRHLVLPPALPLGGSRQTNANKAPPPVRARRWQRGGRRASGRRWLSATAAFLRVVFVEPPKHEHLHPRQRSQVQVPHFAEAHGVRSRSSRGCAWPGRETPPGEPPTSFSLRAGARPMGFWDRCFQKTGRMAHGHPAALWPSFRMA